MFIVGACGGWIVFDYLCFMSRTKAFVLLSLFKEFATEQLCLIRIMSFFLYLWNFVAPWRRLIANGLHTVIEVEMLPFEQFVYCASCMSTYCCYFFYAVSTTDAVRHFRSCGRSHSTPWGEMHVCFQMSFKAWACFKAFPSLRACWDSYVTTYSLFKLYKCVCSEVVLYFYQGRSHSYTECVANFLVNCFLLTVFAFFKYRLLDVNTLSHCALKWVWLMKHLFDFP